MLLIIAPNLKKNTMENYDVIIIGAGHNGLVNACYLQKAGLNVLVLEKNERQARFYVCTY